MPRSKCNTFTPQPIENMKAISKLITLVATGSVAVWFSLSIQAQSIDPATGLPSAPARPAMVNPRLPAVPPGPINHDPKTGLPMFYTEGAVLDTGRKIVLVEEFMAKSEYDDALQLLLDNHHQFKLEEPLSLLMPDWIELSRRFPKAKAALIEIRDQYQHEFDAGRGFGLLFGELNNLNRQLDQDDATYALFQSIRQKDPVLAEQCFGAIAPLLIQRGEFDLCMSYVGDPKENLYSIRKGYESALDNIRRQLESQRRIDQRQAKMNQRFGLTNNLDAQFVADDFAAMQNKTAKDNFVNAARQLIHILVGAGHQAEAEEIQKQARAVLDDARLKSAISDAEERIHRLSAQTDEG